MSAVALTLLAHPDDAEILCGGTLIRLADAGWQLHFATATAGDCGTTSKSPSEISAIRIAEAREAASLIGATYHCLGEMDGFVVYDKPTLRKVYDLLRDVAPALVFTHAPKDYMMDHEQVALLARAATFIYSAPNISTLPLRKDSHVPHLYYCDPVEGIDPFGVPVKPTAYVDITPQIEKKSRMLACHASQREWLRAHHGMDEYVASMRRHGQQRGREVDCQFAEAFVQHRGHAYPHNDLLAELFPINGRFVDSGTTR